MAKSLPVAADFIGSVTGFLTLLIVGEIVVDLGLALMATNLKSFAFLDHMWNLKALKPVWNFLFHRA